MCPCRLALTSLTLFLLQSAPRHVILLLTPPAPAPAQVRCAGTVWLVSLLLYCGRRSPTVQAQLPDIQEVLSQLLGDQNELTQEMASRGLSAAYYMADPGTQKALVESLVGTLSGG